MPVNKDTLLTSLLAASGGKVEVKYNVNGDPSIFVRIPRFNCEDIHPDLGIGPHPAFVVNGAVKSELWIGMYQGIVEKNCILSLPGQNPAVGINFDNAKLYCQNNGPGFHLMTAWEWAAVALWTLKNGTQPRGNTNYGKAYEAAWERGTPVNSASPATTLTGSGPASWRHDGTYQGIADLVGNIWEWNDGFKLVDGRIYAPADNHFTLSENEWPAQSVYFDSPGTPGDRNESAIVGSPILSNGITVYTEPPTPAGGGDTGNFNYTYNASWKAMATSAGYNELSLEVRQMMARLLVAPRVGSGGDPLFPAIMGGVWARNYGARFPRRGGRWLSTSEAGLGTLDLFDVQSSVNSVVGCRPAFLL